MLNPKDQDALLAAKEATATKSINKGPFYDIYRKAGLSLHRCVLCHMNTRVEYKQGYGVRLSCPAGDDVLVRYKAKFPKLTEEEFVVRVVKEWNDRHTLRRN